MSDVLSILATVKQAGLRLEVAGETLRILGHDSPPDGLVALIRDHKAGILKALLHAPSQCPRHTRLVSCVAPLIESMQYGECACCKAALDPDAFGQCSSCHEDIRRVLTRLIRDSHGDWPG